MRGLLPTQGINRRRAELDSRDRRLLAADARVERQFVSTNISNDCTSPIYAHKSRQFLLEDTVRAGPSLLQSDFGFDVCARHHPQTHAGPRRRGDSHILSRDPRHDLPSESDLFDRQHGHVAQAASRSDLTQVATHQDAIDTRDGARRGGIDRQNPGMRVRAPHNARVQGLRQLDIR
jgi:hypothetical protein